MDSNAQKTEEKGEEINMKHFSSESDSSDNEETYNDQFIYVDLLGFRAGFGKFICKEFSLVDKKYFFHALIKSSIMLHKLNSFYKLHAEVDAKYYHRLSYCCGDMPVSELVSKMIPKLRNKVILVEHIQKANQLKYIFRHCEEKLNCITLDQLNYNKDRIKIASYAMCDYHKKVYGWEDRVICTLSTALTLRDIVKECERKNDSK